MEAGPPRVNMRPRSDTFVIEEWERIFRQFSRYEDWLGENPQLTENSFKPSTTRMDLGSRRSGEGCGTS